MSVVCTAVAARLPSTDEVAGVLASHASSCLRCQAEQARYRSLLRALGSLPLESVRAPDDLVGSVVARLDESVDRRSSPAVVKTAVAAAAGAVVVAAGAFVLVGWRRVRAA